MFHSPCIVLVPQGKSVEKKLSEWLNVVGVDGLDEVNKGASVGRDIFNPDWKLTYRMTGIKIALKFDYRGRDGPESVGDPTKEDGIVCYITAKLTDGKNKFRAFLNIVVYFFD